MLKVLKPVKRAFRCLTPEGSHICRKKRSRRLLPPIPTRLRRVGMGDCVVYSLFYKHVTPVRTGHPGGPLEWVNGIVVTCVMSVMNVTKCNSVQDITRECRETFRFVRTQTGEEVCGERKRRGEKVLKTWRLAIFPYGVFCVAILQNNILIRNIFNWLSVYSMILFI